MDNEVIISVWKSETVTLFSPITTKSSWSINSWLLVPIDFIGFEWRAREDSNLWPLPPEEIVLWGNSIISIVLGWKFSLVHGLSSKANDYLIRKMNENAGIAVITGLTFVAFAGPWTTYQDWIRPIDCLGDFHSSKEWVVGLGCVSVSEWCQVRPNSNAARNRDDRRPSPSICSQVSV